MNETPCVSRDGKQYFWCTWTQPWGLPSSDVGDTWPGYMMVWVDGPMFERRPRKLYAYVWASSVEDAEDKILGCYGESSKKIIFNSVPEAKGADVPFSDGRFPFMVADLQNLQNH